MMKSLCITGTEAGLADDRFDVNILVEQRDIIAEVQQVLRSVAGFDSKKEDGPTLVINNVTCAFRRERCKLHTGMKRSLSNQHFDTSTASTLVIEKDLSSIDRSGRNDMTATFPVGTTSNTLLYMPMEVKEAFLGAFERLPSNSIVWKQGNRMPAGISTQNCAHAVRRWFARSEFELNSRTIANSMMSLLNLSGFGRRALRMAYSTNDKIFPSDQVWVKRANTIANSRAWSNTNARMMTTFELVCLDIIRMTMLLVFAAAAFMWICWA